MGRAIERKPQINHIAAWIAAQARDAALNQNCQPLVERLAVVLREMDGAAA